MVYMYGYIDIGVWGYVWNIGAMYGICGAMYGI